MERDEEQRVLVEETSQEAQRNLPTLLAQLGEKAMDGTVSGTAALVAARVLTKKFGDGKPDDKDQKPEADPPSS